MYDFIFDGILDKILDNFFTHLNTNNFFTQILKDKNFVRFQPIITNTIDTFIKNNIKHIQIKNKSNDIQDIITFLYYYIFIGISYHYEGGRDTFITNLVEISKNQSKSKTKITDFFNSISNGHIIHYYSIIKNILELIPLKTIDRIKLSLINAPIKFQSTIDFIKLLGENFVINRIIENKEHFHILVKSIIIKDIYFLKHRNNLISIIDKDTDDDAEYTYITVVSSIADKMIDFTTIEKILSPQQIRQGMAFDIYNFLLDYRTRAADYIQNRDKNIDYLFTKKILTPITEDFLRFHKSTEKYQSGDKISKDDTKAKYIISKLNKIKNYYSPNLIENPQLKLNVKNMFYNPLFDRLATLVNVPEDVRIINKLKEVETKDVDDIINDMDILTKYAYLNFNHFSKDGFKIRTSLPVEAIRYINLNPKYNPSYLETRVGDEIIDFNVVGVVFNKNKLPPDIIKSKNLKLPKDNSTYQDFLDKISKDINKDNDELFYWLFDINNDKLDMEFYENALDNDKEKVIHIFLQDFHHKYYQLLLQKIKKDIKNKNINNHFLLYKLIKFYDDNYAQLSREPDVYNQIIHFFNKHMIKNIDITPDIIDQLIPGKNDNIIKLPIVKIDKQISKTIMVQDKDTTTDIIPIEDKAICVHHLIWKELIEMNSRDIDTFNQKIFDFLKLYITENKNSDYVCKSCNEIINIQKYQITGTFVEELDTFMTTAVGVSQALEKIPKYRSFARTIRNLDRVIENIGINSNIKIFVGNDPIIKLRRKLIIKDVIDTIKLHTKYIKDTIKDRPNDFSKRYGINPSYSELFFFELKDDIFLTSTKDTDKFKKIKYNNLMTYSLLFMLLELTSGQLIEFKETKKINFYLFQKFNNVFDNLKIRLNQQEIIRLSKLPLLSYAIYVFSGILVQQKLWLYDIPDKPKDIIIKQKQAQTDIIHTFIDLINSFVEASIKKTDMIYEIIYQRFYNKIKNTFQDDKMFDRIKNEKLKRISFQDNKAKFLDKKIPFINIPDDTLDDSLSEIKFSKCFTSKHQLSKLDLEFSAFQFSKDKLAQITNKQINRILKKLCDNKDNYVAKLCSKYGDAFDKNIDPKDIDIIKQVIANNDAKRRLAEFVAFKKQQDLYIKQQQNIKNNINKFNLIFNDKNVINNFIKDLQNIIGNKIKTDFLEIYINDDIIFINHDLLGNTIKDTRKILSSQIDIKYEFNNTFNTQVLYFFDDKNKHTLYYNKYTLQYLGYSYDKNKIQKIFSNHSLQIKYSIYNIIQFLGTRNIFEDIQFYFDTIPNNNTDIINKIMTERIVRIRNIIMKTNSIINKVKNTNIPTSNKTNEDKLVNEFIDRIKNIQTSDNDHSVFKKWKYLFYLTPDILDQEFIIEDKHFFDITKLNKINNIDFKMILYLISQLHLLLKINSSKKLQFEIAYFIIAILHFNFYYYYQDIKHIEIRKFQLLINNEDEFLEPSYKVIGLYQELISLEELESDEFIDKQIDIQEEADALDFDDMDDEYDEQPFEYGSMEISL